MAVPAQATKAPGRDSARLMDTSNCLVWRQERAVADPFAGRLEPRAIGARMAGGSVQKSAPAQDEGSGHHEQHCRGEGTRQASKGHRVHPTNGQSHEPEGDGQIHRGQQRATPKACSRQGGPGDDENYEDAGDEERPPVHRYSVSLRGDGSDDDPEQQRTDRGQYADDLQIVALVGRVGHGENETARQEAPGRFDSESG